MINTTRIATGGMAIRLVQELTCTDNALDPIQIMWAKLGNTPISRYFAEAAGEYLKTWGRTALGAIIRELQNGRHGQKVLICGHAVLQNALLWAVGEMLETSGVFGHLAIQTLAEVTLGEGEAFVVRFDDDGRADCDYLRPMA
jgi:hypothetical protein